MTNMKIFLKKKNKKAMLNRALSPNLIQIADCAGTMNLIVIIPCFRSANVEGELSLSTISVLKVGLKLKNIDRSLPIIQVFIGDNFNVKFANHHYPMSLEIIIGIIH